MGKYFGTDGFRGEANEVLTVEHAFKVGRFLGWYYGRDHKARVSYWKRYKKKSSYMFEDALCCRTYSEQVQMYIFCMSLQHRVCPMLYKNR